MKLTKAHKTDKIITLETETQRSFLGVRLKPLKRVFIATREYPSNYWNWMETPNNTIVPSKLSFQLDEWYRLWISFGERCTDV